MRVLVTRPAEDGARIAEALAARGHTVILSPVMEIVALGQPLPADDDFNAIIATSANAFLKLEESASQKSLRSLPVLVVGERTAQAAREAGFTNIRAVAPDASTLMERVHDTHLPPARFLYLAGRDRKSLLETALAEDGHEVKVIEVYAAEAAGALAPSVAETLRAGQADAVLHFSRRSADLFAGLGETAGLGDAARALLHVCISVDAAEGLRRLGARRVLIAAHPDLDGILQALEKAAP